VDCVSLGSCASYSWYSVRGIVNVRRMSVELIVGLPNMGKSYEMTRRAFDAVSRGIPVFSNYKLGYGDEQPLGVRYWKRPEDLLDLDKGLIIVDEAQVYFNSRMWMSFDIDVQRKFQQHSKDGLNILGTVQHQDRIDVVIRELVQKYHVVRKFFGSDRDSGKSWGMYKVSTFFPEEMKKADGKPISAEYHWFKNSIAQWYDTLAKIEIPEAENIITIKYRVCPECGSRSKIGLGVP